MTKKSARAGAPPRPSEDIDFDLLPGLVGYNLRRAQVVLFSSLSGALTELELTPGLFGLLVLIGANPGLSQSALARAMGIERSTMVASIDGLESRGLVERRPSQVDRRSNALVLSRKGRTLLKRAKELVQECEEGLFSGLADAERDTLRRLLRQIWSRRN
ncbi:MAG: MarR family transcriptional regulator [Hyphomicrobiales bacterium]|nr:MarR family transcriptional regulator [Hyphomicrobiales bacterium]MCP5371037.1 MarR family transcriptional regulator [Hyphomicrobiales bacterium]